MKVNEKTLAAIRSLDVTAGQILAVTSTENNQLKVRWSGISALDFIELTARAMHSIYISQSDEFKQQVSYQQFIDLFTEASKRMEIAHAENGNKTIERTEV